MFKSPRERSESHHVISVKRSVPWYVRRPGLAHFFLRPQCRSALFCFGRRGAVRCSNSPTLQLSTLRPMFLFPTMALRICSHRLYNVRGRRALVCQAARGGRSAAASIRPTTRVTIDRKWFSTEEQTDESKVKDDEPPKLLYEGPFAALSLRLKRVSVSTAALGIVGMPLLMALHGGDVPATGQLAIGGTAIIAAAGSTVALSFCFSPYVHKLEQVVATKEDESAGGSSNLIKATTANILGMRVETIFDPATDVRKAAGSRPFCNFTAKGLPMYVHSEMVYDDELRLQLVGEAELELQEKAKEAAKKNDDDEFL